MYFNLTILLLIIVGIIVLIVGIIKKNKAIILSSAIALLIILGFFLVTAGGQIFEKGTVIVPTSSTLGDTITDKKAAGSLKKYSDENYTFEYPQTYKIEEKTQPVRVIVEGKKGKLEIFQLKSPNGERPKDFGFEGTNPPQKMKVVENNKTWFDVWMYYDVNDKKTEDELMAIFDSIKLK